MWWSARLLAVFAAAAIFSLPLLAQSPMLPGFPPGVFGGRAALDASSGGVTGWCGAIPQTGLVNCWPFDSTYTTSGTATDPVGGKNATLTNVTLNGSGPSANLNNSGAFNGLTSEGDTTLTGPPGSAFSIVIWINPQTAISGAARAMSNCHTDSDNNGFQIIPQAAPSDIVLNAGNGSTHTGGSYGQNLAIGTWEMLTATYDGTNIKQYNGATNFSTTAFTGPMTTCATNVTFGRDPAFGGVDFFEGLIAGVAIYNIALTSGQVTTINGL